MSRERLGRELDCDLDVDLSRPFVIGRGNVLYLSGRCRSEHGRIRQLSMVVDGTPGGAAHLLPEGGDFWALLPFRSIPADRTVTLALRAELDDGSPAVAPLGTLDLVAVEERPSAAAGGAEVVICMATHNPAPDLFELQVQSLRRQTYTDWTCLISDDCSEEEAFDHIRGAVGDDSRFSVTRAPVRLGFYRNFERVLGLVPSGARFVALCDQDDEWYEDKLAACLAEFRTDDVQLVYSDMDIVTRDGVRLSSTYWTARTNNYTDLETLLLANTVTGASTVFRVGLLDRVLPFPDAAPGGMYHDQWIACVALASGGVRYVDRPLYAYRQHAGNVIGHADVPSVRPWPQFVSLAWWLRAITMPANDRPPDDRPADDRPANDRPPNDRFLSDMQLVYRSVAVRTALMAAILRLRVPEVADRTAATLDRLARFDESWAGLAGQAARALVSRRPATLGVEWLCLRSAVGLRLLGTLSRIRGRAFPVREAGRDAAAPVDFLARKVAPLRLDVDPTAPRRVNIVISEITGRYLFAGYLAVFELARQLQRRGHRVRYVVVDPCDLDDVPDAVTGVELVSVADRGTWLGVSPDDRFLATSWWTAHIASAAARDLGRDRFAFLVQEYEPVFYPGGSLGALAEQAYALPHDALFSTPMLRDHFARHRIGVFAAGGGGAERSTVFRNAVVPYGVDARAMEERSTRRLLFYARPEPNFERNMFELGVLALRAVVDQAPGWEFDGMGAVSRFADVPLGAGVVLRMMTRLDLARFRERLPSYDVGLSLMHSPHPSVMPLDMAAAGLVTVTNTYGTKTADALAAISSNIRAVPPTLEGITAGLLDAMKAADDVEARVAGARLDWPASWDDAFDGDVLAALERFLAG